MMTRINNTNRHVNTGIWKQVAKMFAKDNPWRPVHLACVLFLITGYFFYSAAYLLPTPQWGRDLMTWAMPTVKALDSAARVGAIKSTDPFPAQVVILYCALGSILLTVWYVYAGTCNTRLQRKLLCDHQKVPHEKRPSKSRYFLSGVVLLLATIFGFYVFFWFTTSNLSWHAFKFYSSSIGSVSFLLFVAAFTPGIVVFFSPMFYRNYSGRTYEKNT